MTSFGTASDPFDLPVVPAGEAQPSKPEQRPASTSGPVGPAHAIRPVGGVGLALCRRCRCSLLGGEVPFGMCGDCGDRWRRCVSLRNLEPVA